MNFKSSALILFKMSIIISLLAWVSSKTDIENTFQIVKNFELKYFLSALIVLLLQIVIATIRWRKVLNSLNILYPFKKVFYYLWIGLFFNQVLPSSIGGDVFRGHYICKEGCSIKKSILSVLLDRIFGVIGLVILVAIMTPIFFNRVNDSTAQFGLIILSIGSIGIISLIFTLDLFPKKLLHWRVVRGLFSLTYEARRLMFSSLSGIKLITLSVVIHIFSIISIVILSQAESLDISWINIMLIVPLTTLFMTIPISIAGWGVREGVMVIGLGYLGVSSESALALSILFGLLQLVISLPGILFWILTDQRYY